MGLKTSCVNDTFALQLEARVRFWGFFSVFLLIKVGKWSPHSYFVTLAETFVFPCFLLHIADGAIPMPSPSTDSILSAPPRLSVP